MITQVSELEKKLVHNIFYMFVPSYLNGLRDLKFGTKVTFRLNWIDKTFGSEPSVRLSVRPLQISNSRYHDFFRAVRSRLKRLEIFQNGYLQGEWTD